MTFSIFNYSCLGSRAKQCLPSSFRKSLSRARYKLANFIRYGTPSIFFTVEIETTTVCNRKCSYCPNSRFDRGHHQMEIALFRKIIDDLAEMGYSGKVHPHFYGEPLLDERLQEFVLYIRERLPRAGIVIYSNGDYLTLDLFAHLIAAGTDSFVITPHDGKALDKVKALYSYANAQSELEGRIEYRVFTEETPLSSRAGLVSPAKVQVMKSCIFPSECIVIDYLGNVVLCCDDYFSSVILGNVRDENLLQIWKKPSNQRLREQLGRGVFDLEICKRCTQTQ